MAGERTEAPTPKRLRDARQRGDTPKSQELVSMGVLLAAVVGLRWVAPGLGDYLQDVLRDGLGTQPADDLTPASALSLGRSAGLDLVLAMTPFFALLGVAAVVFNLGQTGFLLTASRLKPNLTSISPHTGLKRLYGKEGLANLARALLKMGVVALMVGWMLRDRLAELALFGQLPVPLATARLSSLAFDIALRTAVVLFALTLLDFAWQRRQFFQRMRMTRQELRQDLRESDGDPQIKAAIRRRRQSLLNRMIASVPKADVVVTNPTHYAVALKYDPVSMAAPMVVAKGERLLAQRIKEVARKSGVPVLEEPPLARALFAAVPVGSPVPANLYQAVAEVLAWVYALRDRTRRVSRNLGAQGAT